MKLKELLDEIEREFIIENFEKKDLQRWFKLKERVLEK